MAIWKDNTAAKIPSPATDFAEPARPYTPLKSEPAPAPEARTVARSEPAAPRKESLIASDITIEGKIDGGGSVRIAGKFKGDVNVQGDLTIELGAKLTGSVRADKVTIAGELEGNIESATLVDLQQTGVVVGDVNAASVVVASGARLRGQVQFGWDDGKGSRSIKNGNGYDS